MSKVIFRFCKTCGFYNAPAKTCAIMATFKGEIEPNDFCSKYREAPVHCERCRAITFAPILVVDANGTYHSYCQGCVPQ